MHHDLKTVKMKAAITYGIIAPILIATAVADNIPTGQLLLNARQTAGGSIPIVSWDVQYPTDPKIDEQNQLIASEDSLLEVRAIGSNYWNGENQIQLKINTEKREQLIFSGLSKEFVTTEEPLFSTTVAAGQKINFGMMGLSEESGSYFRWTNTPLDNPDHSFAVLRNGDEFPAVTPMARNGQVTNYLHPYIDKETGRVSIGPADVLFVVELDRRFTFEQSGDPADKGYDMLDMVFLVSFK
ncbi:hypothetical protein [Persicirhabdus sediminis]|uniref:Uncharacterized protein n=1 Tax=Persicirhabdus sediminis TaxID=454144 RepID=A0A8J7MBL9_9BACT|nr:hypothetical protein [Persicirhabdus sediminis]MBK1790122.1 hypothetical protein [Persicirhabdus sediminis]